MNIDINIISQLSDNYAYIVHNNNEAIIIDPADEIPILKIINKKNLKPLSILITHNHSDHTSGINGLLNHFDLDVYSSNLAIKETTKLVKDNQKIEFKFIDFNIIATPGHTLDHIVYFSDKEKILFSGDTLFRLGCGRVFEGTLNEMFNSLQKINELEKNTLIYCGHEYTLNNLNFLKKILPKGNFYLEIEKKIHADLRNKGKTIPFLLEDEKTYNLFMNQTSKIGTMIKEELGFSDFELFAYLRKGKDNF